MAGRTALFALPSINHTLRRFGSNTLFLTDDMPVVPPHPVALTLLNQVLGKLPIGGGKGSQSQGFARVELDVESSKGHAAPEPERGLGKAVREAERLQAGSRVGQNLRSEIKVGIGSEDRAIDLPLLQLAEQATRLLKLLRSLWVLLFHQEQGADLSGDGGR